MAIPKCLLVFDLNCLLGYRQITNILNHELRAFDEMKAHISEGDYSTIYRPNSEILLHNIFSKKRKYLDVGIWAHQNKEETNIQVDQFFRSLKYNIKFVLFTKNENKNWIENYITYSQKEIASQLIPGPINRDLSIIFKKNPEYNKDNTLVISNFKNLDKRYEDNDIVLPLYHPKGNTSKVRDAHFYFLTEYINYIIALRERNNGKIYIYIIFIAFIR